MNLLSGKGEKNKGHFVIKLQNGLYLMLGLRVLCKLITFCCQVTRKF